MNTDGEKRPNFSRLVDAQGSRRLGPKYRLSKRVYSARAGQLLTAAYLFAPNSYSIAKLVRNAGLLPWKKSPCIAKSRTSLQADQDGGPSSNNGWTRLI